MMFGDGLPGRKILPDATCKACAEVPSAAEGRNAGRLSHPIRRQFIVHRVDTERRPTNNINRGSRATGVPSPCSPPSPNLPARPDCRHQRTARPARRAGLEASARRRGRCTCRYRRMR
jgi:hypothetical protein